MRIERPGVYCQFPKEKSPRLAKRGNPQMTLIFADEKSVLIGEICG
ncbi:MAG: hypothetical protein VX413_02605 [Verrucomicrobiota bacterium]|nr:hypothetical protein [Verrucomicrobiota bacterium]|tara:strand:+ start:259 stop:396 length:138 start_codon:yes stop_codon:yes gene_type:complete